MKIAIAVWDKRVAPLFDSCQSCLIVDSEDLNDVTDFTFVSTTPESKAQEIISSKIEHLICGAIPNRIECFLIESGCKVYPFLTGGSDEILDAFLDNNIDDMKYRMPGCANRAGRDCAKRGKGLTNDGKIFKNRFNR